MAILRNPRKQNFTTICNDALRDQDLSLKARGLLTSMMSLPDNWEFSEAGLDKIFPKDGLASIRSGLKELERSGYLIRERSRDEHGRMSNVVWTISDYPILEKPQLGKPRLENPSVDNPSVENHTQLNNNQLKNKGSRNKESNNDTAAPSWMCDPELSPRMISAISNWLEYKKERREGYKPAGLKALLSQIKNQVRQYGEEPVIDIMLSSMGSGYKGICFDKLKNRSWQRPQGQGGNPFMEILREEQEKKYGQGRDGEDFVTVESFVP